MTIAMSIEYLLWYFPVLAAVSLVLAGARHEKKELIVKQAWHNAIWITVFLLVISGLLWFASLWI